MKPPHLRVAKPLLSASTGCSGESSLNENYKATKLQQEEEKEVKKYRLYYQLYFACALNQIFIIIHAEEGFDDSNNKGGDKDEDNGGNKDEEGDTGDEEEDKEMSSHRTPAAAKAEKKPSTTPTK
jgi:hypothetical protein